MPYKLCVGLLICLICLCTNTASAERRLALVIGNSNYQWVEKLPNPINDASDIAAAFVRMGFVVTQKTDLPYEGLRKTLQEFGRGATGADFAVIYFAGHGIEVENKNFLIPVDARLANDTDVEFEAIPFELVMNTLAGVSGVKILLLDACRNNPFAAGSKRSVATRSIGRGLAPVEPTTGTLVGYAAKEGTTAFDGGARNSPYTAGLLAHIEERGIDIQFMFRKVRDTVIAATGGQQEPFTYGSLPGREIFLNSSTPSPSDVIMLGSDPEEAEFWAAIDGTGNRRALVRYTELYPQGQFRSIAEQQIKRLDEANPTGINLPSLMSPKTNFVQEIQRELNRVGCSAETPDGVWGARSRDALQRFADRSGSDLHPYDPTFASLAALLRSAERICPLVKKQTSVARKPSKPRGAEKTARATSATTASRSPERSCRAETRDECRVRARRAGAPRRSGFCRNLLTICK